MRVAACLYVLQTLTLWFVALREAPRPARGLTWMWLCMLLPGVGLLLYLWFTRPIPVRRRRVGPDGSVRVQGSVKALSPGRETPLPPPSPTGPTACPVVPVMETAYGRFAHPLTHLAQTPLARARVRALADGDKAYRAMLRAVQTARTSVDAEFYIYRCDVIGHAFAQAFADCARRGARVRVLLDGWGSRALSADLLKLWQQSGVQVRVMFPLPPRGTLRDLLALNYRDHCKILVKDGVHGFTGGMNVGLEYTGRKRGTGPWRDTQVELQGPAATALVQVFERNWSIATPITGTHPRHRDEPPRHLRHALHAGHRHPAWALESGEEWWLVALNDERHTTQAGDPVGTDALQAPEAWVQIIQSGPDEVPLRFRDVYFTLVTLAEHTVDITTPYFAPGSDILTALATAARRGVRVRLLLPKVPDHRLIAWAERTYYRDLLQSGVHLHLYTAGILHGKVMTVDGKVGVVGAANYDWRSFRLDFEVGAVVYDEAAVRELTDQFEQDLARAERWDLARLEQQPWWQRALDRSARLLSPFL